MGVTAWHARVSLRCSHEGLGASRRDSRRADRRGVETAQTVTLHASRICTVSGWRWENGTGRAETKTQFALNARWSLYPDLLAGWQALVGPPCARSATASPRASRCST